MTLILRDYEFSDDITEIPDPLWRQLRTLMRKRIQRERKKGAATETDRSNGWDLIMDENRHVVDPPKPKDVPRFVTPEQFADTIDHIARAERAFDIRRSTPNGKPSLDDIKHDVEAAVIGVAAWDDGDFEYAWDALNRLGKTGEIDPYLRYQNLAIVAFEVSEEMPDHPWPEEFVKQLISRVEAVSQARADTISAVWGSYLMQKGKRKESEKLLRKLAEGNPDDPRYYATLAMSLNNAGDKRQAIAAFKNALKIAFEQDDYEMSDTIMDSLIDLGAMTPEDAEELFDEHFGGPEDDESDTEEEDEFIEQAMDEHPDYRDFIFEHGPDAELEGMNPMMHIAMHAAVEQQLREEDFPELRMVLAKLTSEGMPRHDAIHLLAEPLAEAMHEALVKHKPFNHEAYIRKVKKLLR